MSLNAPSFAVTFPHPVLTPITGEPTYTTLQLLQQELYANALANHSTRGGGAHGHLAVIMPAAAYLERSGQPFIVPVHPGAAPIHAVGATGPQITEVNRQYLADLSEHVRYRTVNEELKRQLLEAVPALYLQILADAELGYADVNCADLLAHLRLTYGTISREELETNRNGLTAEWNPDSPVEDLWLRIRTAQRVSIAGNEPIADTTALRLVLGVIEKTGVFATAIDKWQDKEDAEWTLDNFKAHFTKANKERIRKLTAQTAGYHGAHATIPDPPDLSTPGVPFLRTSPGSCMYYCWSHGLGKNRAHVSRTCNQKKEGHKDDATADNMMGGNNRIYDNRTRRPAPTNAE